MRTGASSPAVCSTNNPAIAAAAFRHPGGVLRRNDFTAKWRGFLGRDDVVALYMRLADRFGDHGLIATLVAVREGDALRIDSWLMSCGVFSRGAVLTEARAQGVGRIIGTFTATEKNGVVADLYLRLGFTQTGAVWMLDVGATAPDHAIELR